MYKTRTFPILKRAVEIAGNTYIAIAKSTVDFLLLRKPATVSFERLKSIRPFFFLFCAVARAGVAGCAAHDAHRAKKWFPEEFHNVRVRWLPAKGCRLGPNVKGPGAIRISPFYYTAPPADHRMFAPYFAHPEFYKSGFHRKVHGMREHKRTIRLFFAGSFSNEDKKYSGEFNFPILNRDVILKHLLAKFGNVIETGLNRQKFQPFVMFLTNDTRDVNDKHQLSLPEYMNAMAAADFFLCPPGWRMPHSHNLIEAMSVGTIPLTNYSFYIKPPLTPDVNCLGFTTVEELESTVKRILNMPAGEIARLRMGVLAYYEQYLEPESFGKTFINNIPRLSELVVNDESGR